MDIVRGIDLSSKWSLLESGSIFVFWSRIAGRFPLANGSPAIQSLYGHPTLWAGRYPIGSTFHQSSKNQINRNRHLLLGARVFRAVIVLSGDVGMAAVIVPDVDPFLAEVGV